MPVFLPESRPADRHPLPKFLMETLKIISGGDGDLASLLATGYTDLTDEECETLLSHAQRFGMNARSILKPIKRADEGQIEKIEEVINKGDRVEIIPAKDGARIIQETRKEIKFNKKTC